MSFDCSSLSIIKARVLIFLQLKDTSRILRFSSVPTSFIVTTFWGVGGLDELKKEWFRVALPIMSAFVLCGCFLSWWTGCCMIVYTGGRLQPGDWWLVTFDIPRLLIRFC